MHDNSGQRFLYPTLDFTMANDDYQSQKRTLRFSKKSIDKSAQNIRHGCVGEERDKAIEMIQNFRELHLYPLMLMKNHLARTSAKVSKKNNCC